MLSIIFFVLGGVSFQSSFAENQVTIPLGASNINTPFNLSPSVLNIQTNDTVTWQNTDIAAHTITTGKPQLGFDGRIDSGIIEPGGSFSYKFDKDGVYEYYCLFHPWMTGLVNVGDGTTVQPAIGISVFTDRPSYHVGDTILVSGQISKLIPNEQITVWITNQKGDTVSVTHVETESGTTFSAKFITGGALWVPASNYTVYAQYGFRSAVAYAPISYETENTSSTVSEQNISTQVNSNTGTSTETNSQNHIMYMSSHKKIIADSKDYVTVQTERHIYKPGEQVIIDGSMWSGLFTAVGGAAYLDTVPISSIGGNSITELVTIQVKDSNGKVVSSQEAQIDNNNDYSATFTLPQGATQGAYNVQSAIELKAGLLGTLDSSTAAKLQSSTKFVVTSPVQYVVKTMENDLNVEIASNSTVNNFEFNSDEKKVSFTVEGQSGTKGVTLITIPKSILWGQITVFIDGIAQTPDSDSVIVTSNTDTETSFEINYHHSMHVIDVIGTQAAQANPSGTQAVPEFGAIASIVLVLAIISTVVFTKTRAKLNLL